MVIFLHILSLAILTIIISTPFFKVEVILSMMSSSNRTKRLQSENILVINLTKINPTFHQFVYHGNITKRTKNEHKRFN
jgi:hypothetical protein